MLGALYAALGAFTFALNNATLRRGVLTGTVMQAMALTVPVGALGFLALAIIVGATPELFSFPLDNIGIVPGTVLEVADAKGGMCAVEISGSIPSLHS